MILRHRNALHASVSALLLVAVVGCSSDSDSPAPAPNPTPNPDTTPDEPGTTPDQPGTTPEPTSAILDGEWLRACDLNENESDGVIYDTVLLTIAGESGTSRQMRFTDENCTIAASPAENVITVSFAYPEATTETPRGAAQHVDVTSVSLVRDGVELTVAQRELVAAQGGFDTRYDIAIVDEDALYFGDLSSDAERDGATAERRPETLEATPYARQ